MFDAEDLSTCLNAMFEADIKDDMLALMYAANETTYFELKTPNGLTEIETMKNKILQGDVLAPMLSSNMVDKNIGVEAIKSENVYLYKNKVVIPPLMMQDDTLSGCFTRWIQKQKNEQLSQHTYKYHGIAIWNI